MTYANVQKALDALNIRHELADDGSGSGLQWLQTGLMVGHYSLQILCPEDYHAVSGELRWSLQLFSFETLEQLTNVEVSSEADERDVAMMALQLVFRSADRPRFPWKSCSKIEEVFS